MTCDVLFLTGRMSGKEGGGEGGGYCLVVEYEFHVCREQVTPILRKSWKQPMKSEEVILSK